MTSVINTNASYSNVGGYSDGIGIVKGDEKLKDPFSGTVNIDPAYVPESSIIIPSNNLTFTSKFLSFFNQYQEFFYIGLGTFFIIYVIREF